MEPGSTASIRAARILLLALFAINCYRAAMISITPPEAATYNRFVGPDLQDSFRLNTANNHVIYTLLARISTSTFHLTDLALRLPGLLACFLYFWAVFRLARRNFGSGPLFLAAVALMSLNPLVLDYLSMARGYGLALALWMWALDLILEHLESNQADGRLKLNLAGVCLGLSVASNLAFLLPAAALGGTFGLLPPARHGGLRFHNFWLPALLTGFLILVIPLNHTDFSSFNPGATSLRQTINSLTALSLFHANPAGLPAWLAAAARIGAGGIVIVALTVVVRRHRPGGLEYLVSGTTVGGFVALELGHRWLRIPLPLGRAGLYFIPVLTLAALCLVQRIGWKPLEWALLLASSGYLVQLNVNRYGEWPEYANARAAIKAIRQDAGDRPVRVGASLGWEQVLNYYRSRYALGRWPEVTAGPRGTFDYYVLNRQDASIVFERRLRVLWRDGNLTVAR